ncbi:MAG: hypothetical protein RBT25_07870 [Lentisphaeria bacterium]|nr:hypothetical protein [Lentisphaeria bacterium]
MTKRFLREGAFHEVRKLLDEFPDNGLPIASHLARRKGMACIGEGDFPAATGFLRTAAGSEDAVLASQARLALAEALEALFDWDNAAVEYKKLASSSPVHWHRQEAAYALKRIGELRQLPLASDRGKVIVPLRDDRSTRGCWPLGYGADFHLLAAQNFITDRKGGAGPAMPCRFRTTDPKEKSRLWVTRLRDEDPVALWNPHEKSHTSANRDDYGEQYPLGNGPDLLMSCEIPAGRHVLALYFANDYNYYESQRAYTISVTDADRRLLCLAPVRDFGGGLYKRFAVQGPARLEFRIWRNMSINVILTGVFLDEWRLPVLPPCLTIAGQDEPLAKHYESLRLAITSATLMDFPALLEECDTLLDTLSTTAVLPSERTCRYWVKSRLLRLTGMPVNGIKALNAALVNYAEPGDVYRLVTDSFPEVATNQPSLAWYQPGTHELDILWHRYFALLDQQAKPPSLEKLLALSQDDDWRVTSTAMCEATKRLAKFKQLPISVNLATRLCIAMKIMDEAKYEEALDELNSLEDEARRIGDETVASRARNRLLSLSGRIDFVPDQLSQLHEKLVATGASEAACGVAALRTAKAFEKMRKFNEAKVWLDKVPSAAMSEKGRRILLERWETMESELNLLKGRKP